MTSDRINDLFDTIARDLTPAPARHAVHVLYAPVSHDPEVTKLCASVLSDTELQRADRFVTQSDKTLFKQRRAFRRFCGAQVLGTLQHLSQIDFKQTDKGRPHLLGAPNFWFSFSSCRFGFIGAWSSTHGIGVDFEDQTKEIEVTELAKQYFSINEAGVVAGSGRQASLQTFFQFWSLKEAALKSIGEGLPFGLDTFEFKLDPQLRVVNAPPEYGGKRQFSAHVIDRTDSCVALVIRKRV